MFAFNDFSLTFIDLYSIIEGQDDIKIYLCQTTYNWFDQTSGLESAFVEITSSVTYQLTRIIHIILYIFIKTHNNRKMKVYTEYMTNGLNCLTLNCLFGLMWASRLFFYIRMYIAKLTICLIIENHHWDRLYKRMSDIPGFGIVLWSVRFLLISFSAPLVSDVRERFPALLVVAFDLVVPLWSVKTTQYALK